MKNLRHILTNKQTPLSTSEQWQSAHSGICSFDYNPRGKGLSV